MAVPSSSPSASRRLQLYLQSMIRNGRCCCDHQDSDDNIERMMTATNYAFAEQNVDVLVPRSEFVGVQVMSDVDQTESGARRVPIRPGGRQGNPSAGLHTSFGISPYSETLLHGVPGATPDSDEVAPVGLSQVPEDLIMEREGTSASFTKNWKPATSSIDALELTVQEQRRGTPRGNAFLSGGDPGASVSWGRNMLEPGLGDLDGARYAPSREGSRQAGLLPEPEANGDPALEQRTVVQCRVLSRAQAELPTKLTPCEQPARIAPCGQPAKINLSEQPVAVGANEEGTPAEGAKEWTGWTPVPPEGAAAEASRKQEAPTKSALKRNGASGDDVLKVRRECWEGYIDRMMQKVDEDGCAIGARDAATGALEFRVPRLSARGPPDDDWPNCDCECGCGEGLRALFFGVRDIRGVEPVRV